MYNITLVSGAHHSYLIVHTWHHTAVLTTLLVIFPMLMSTFVSIEVLWIACKKLKIAYAQKGNFVSESQSGAQGLGV